MDAGKIADLLLAEYLFLQKSVEEFDGKSLAPHVFPPHVLVSVAAFLLFAAYGPSSAP